MKLSFFINCKQLTYMANQTEGMPLSFEYFNGFAYLEDELSYLDLNISRSSLLDFELSNILGYREELEIEFEGENSWRHDLEVINSRRNGISTTKDSGEDRVKCYSFKLNLGFENFSKFKISVQGCDFLVIQTNVELQDSEVHLSSPQVKFFSNNDKIYDRYLKAKKNLFLNALQLEAGKLYSYSDSDLRKITYEISCSLAKEESSDRSIYSLLENIILGIDACRDRILLWHDSRLAKDTLEKLRYGELSDKSIDQDNAEKLYHKYNNFIPKIDIEWLLAWGEDEYYNFKYDSTERADYANHPRLNKNFDITSTIDAFKDVILRSNYLTASLLRLAFMHLIFLHERQSYTYHEFNKKNTIPKLVGSNRLEKFNLKKSLVDLGRFILLEPLKIAALLGFYYLITDSNWGLCLLLTVLTYGFIVARGIVVRLLEYKIKNKIIDKEREIKNLYMYIINELGLATPDWGGIRKAVKTLWGLDVPIHRSLRDLIDYKF